ncbi:MAG: hypothetical protein ACXWC3_15025 [Burkholderiales bacterium]
MSSPEDMSAATQALLMVWTDIPAEIEPQFNDWYNRGHLRERIEVPGFIRARRFAALSGAPKYLALYEAHADVLQSEPYLRFKKVRDSRTMQFTSLFRNTLKATCDVTARAGAGEGAFLVLQPITIDAARRTAFRNWVRSVLFPEALQSSGVMAATLAEHNSDLRETAAPHDVRTGDRHLDSVLMLEAASEHGVNAAISHLDRQTLEHHGATPHLVMEPSSFRVLYTMHA